MEIIWSKNAQITFEAIVNYLEIDFGVTTAKKFIAKADGQIKMIAKFPKMHKAVSVKNSVRKAVISKQCSLYYELNKNSIVLHYY